ncbi:MAG TPA: ABC transporter permease [Chloroflexia bacterium]|nr:ABC transporter permease [Chloroflexia bacterium]
MRIVPLIPGNRGGKDKKQDGLPEQTGVLLAGSGSASSQNLRNISLIIGREYKSRVEKRSFKIGTLLMAVLIVVALFVPIIIEYFTTNAQAKVTVVNQNGAVAGMDITRYFDQRLNLTINSTGQTINVSTSQKKQFQVAAASPAEIDSLRQQVKDGKLDLLVVINRDANGKLIFSYYENVSGNRTNNNLSQVQAAATELNFLDKLSQVGVSQAQLNSLFEPPQAQVINTQQQTQGRSEAETIAAYILAMGGIILIFGSILQYGTMVAQGAVEEKSNRVMEIMVNAATPFQLMMGKIIGIGLAGCTQMGIMVLAGIGAFLGQGPVRSLVFGTTNGESQLDIGSISLVLLGLIILYFVLGFLLYATLFAAMGSLISRQEEVQTAIAPLTYLFLAGYLAAIFALNAPDSSWVIILSYIPFFTPVLMLARVANTMPAWWEIIITTLIMVGSVLLFTWLAARIYRAGVLMYGQKPKFSRLFKLVVAR